MPGRGFHYIATAVILFGTWIVLSGKFDALHLGMGVVSAIGVAWVSGDLLYSHDGRGGRVWLTRIPWLRVALYIPWLSFEIIKANIHVLKLVLGPTSRLAPKVVRFNPKMAGELGRVVLGNSITLTPGTVTLDIEPDGTYIVHAIDQPSADGVLDGSMAKRVSHAVGDLGDAEKGTDS